MMRDSLGRRIDYVRISVTDLCNLRCIYCMPEEGICKKNHADILNYEEITRIVRLFVSLGVEKIRLTGGEPLVRHRFPDLVKMLSSIQGLKELTVTTNGILLAQMAEDLKNNGLHRVNISIDTLREDRFHSITRVGSLQDALKGLHAALKVGLAPVKVNTVVMNGINTDEALDFAAMAVKYGLEWRFIEFMPLAGVAGLQQERFYSNEQLKKDIETRFTLVPDEDSHSLVSHTYKIKGTDARIGFISPMSHKFCYRCNRLRLTSDGIITPCLMHADAFNVRALLRDGSSDDAICDFICRAVDAKPKEHLGSGVNTMHSLGG